MPTTPGGVAMRRGLIVLYKHSREEERIVLVIRLPEDIERRLADLAAATGRTKSFYAHEAILEHIGDPPSLQWTPMLAFRSWRGVSDEYDASGFPGVFQTRGG